MTLDFNCPVCDEPFENKRGRVGLRTEVIGTVSEKAREVRGHYHLAVRDLLACVNGHEWRIEDLMLHRER